MREIRLAVFDFDNTLWENMRTSEIAVRGFITRLSRDSGLSEDSIKAGTRKAFENNFIFEYPDSIRHNPVLQDAFPGEDLNTRFAGAIHAFHDAIREQTRPYAGIRNMLRRLKLSGIKLVCYSESSARVLANLMKPMGIDSLFDIVCSTPSAPQYAKSADERMTLRDVSHGLSTRQMEVAGMPEGTSPKDHPEILSMLLDAMNVQPHEAVMVGDHLVRDVDMAQKIGVRGFWAKYGRDSVPTLTMSAALRPYVQHLCEQHVQGTHNHVVPHAVLHQPEDLLRHIGRPMERKVLPFPRPAPKQAASIQVMADNGNLR